MSSVRLRGAHGFPFGNKNLGILAWDVLCFERLLRLTTPLRPKPDFGECKGSHSRLFLVQSGDTRLPWNCLRQRVERNADVLQTEQWSPRP